MDVAKPLIISAVILTNILLNSTAIAVILRYPQLREDHTTLFMFSLTLSDLASGCITMPISAAVCSKATPLVHSMVPYLPMIHATLSSWFTLVSCHSLCWMTVCKMITITRPLRYEQIITRNRCYFVIGLTWVAGVFVAGSVSYLSTTWDLDSCMYAVSFVSLTSKEIVFINCVIFVSLVIPVLAIHYATVKILAAVYRAHVQISAQVNSIEGTSSAVGSYSTLTLHAIRSGKNMLIICFVLLILTLPIAIPLIYVTVRRENNIPSWYKFMALWIYMINYSANSLLYIILFRAVRKKTIQMFSQLWEFYRY